MIENERGEKIERERKRGRTRERNDNVCERSRKETHACVPVMESVNTQYTDFLYPVSTACMLRGINAS